MNYYFKAVNIYTKEEIKFSLYDLIFSKDKKLVDSLSEEMEHSLVDYMLVESSNSHYRVTKEEVEH